MSGYDVLAWIVPTILVGAAVPVFWLMGSLPGRVARCEPAKQHPVEITGTAAIFTDHFKVTT